MTTKQVFENIISERGWYHKLGFSKPKGNSISKRYRDGILSNDLIEEIITKFGYTVKQEKLWDPPPASEE